MIRAAIVRLLLATALVATPAAAWVPLAFLADDGGGEEVRWVYWQQVRDDAPIPFSISSLGTPDITLPPGNSAIDEFEAITEAFRAWEDVPGAGVRFELTPTTTNTYGYDGENVIFFADLGNFGYGAVTLLTFDNVTGELLDVDIHMNDNKTEWTTSPNGADGEPLPCPCTGSDPAAAFQNDVQGLATHEIGHALGLDHSPLGQQTSAATPTMYPNGIFFVPGDSGLPPNSRYRTVELDDVVGLQALYPPAGQAGSTARLDGVVHDRWDAPLFGGHVVAQDVVTGEQTSVTSGLREGPFDPAGWSLPGLPPGSYRIRVEPIDGSPPGNVSPGQFGGIPQSVMKAKFPADADLPRMFHRLVYSRDDATALDLTAGEERTITFRPVATLDRRPQFLRKPRALPLAGNANPDVSGPLSAARLIYSLGDVEHEVPFPLDGSPFEHEIPPVKPGTLVTYRAAVETLAGETFETPPSSTQIGLSDAPLILVSKTGLGRLSVVDSQNLFEIDETPSFLSFPLGHAFHRRNLGVYVASFGTDKVTFVPMSRGSLPPTFPNGFDTDGDRLLNGFETAIGTDPANPDSDGDLALDGAEVSERFFDGAVGVPAFDLLGSTFASGGTQPIGSPHVTVAIWNVTQQLWASPLLPLTPSGRFRLRLKSGPTYRVSFFNAVTSTWIHDSVTFEGSPGDTQLLGPIEVPLEAPPGPLADSGTDPLDDLDGPLGLLLTETTPIFLALGANPYGVALHPRDQRFLYVTGHGADRVYKIDTETNLVAVATSVPDAPKGIAISRDATRVYVASEGGSVVSVLDSDTLEILDTIQVDGSPQYVAITRDGSKAIVTSTGGAAVTFIDTSSNLVTGEASTGAGGLVFLSGQSRQDLALAGSFFVGSHEVVLIDAAGQELSVIDLGPGVETTSGMALDAAGAVGWVVHHGKQELLEIELESGAILRRLPIEAFDARDLSAQPIFRRRQVRDPIHPGGGNNRSTRTR